MAANNQLLTYGALGVAAYFLYEKFGKPQQASTMPAPVDPYTQAMTAPFTYTGTARDPVTGYPTYGQPIIQPPVYLGPQPSNLNPGAAVGGVVGTCMFRKGWPQEKCQQRLDLLVSAFKNATDQAKANTASGDTAGATLWANAANGHRTDYYNLTGVYL